MSIVRVTAALAVVAGTAWLASATIESQDAAERYWPQWRGRTRRASLGTQIRRFEWSETTNIRWKFEIPGRGLASPVIWGDRLFLVTAVPVDVDGPACASAPWRHPPEGRASLRGHGTRSGHGPSRVGTDGRRGSAAGAVDAGRDLGLESAITDGRYVVASFDSAGLYAFDMNGSLLWQKRFGGKRMFAEVGESGGMPILYKDRLVVTWDHQGESFVAALDVRTGEELWRSYRDEVDSWATPLWSSMAAGLRSSPPRGTACAATTSRRAMSVWETAGLTMNPIPSPVAEDGLVILMSGFRGSQLRAVRLADARGEITGSPAVAWTLDRDTPTCPHRCSTTASCIS